MTLKKTRLFIAIITICLALIISTVQTIAMALATSSFTDITYYTRYTTAIDYLKSEGVVVGYADGTFRPEANISRAEFLKILLVAKNYSGEGKDCFKDVKGSAWFVPYVCQAKALGFISGYSDGTFKPNQSISFTEASKIIANVLELETDDSLDDNWYQKFITALENKRAIPTSIVSMDKKITRAEMAEMIWRIQTENSSQSSLGYNLLERIGTSDLNSLKSFESCTDMQAYMDENLAVSPTYDYEGASPTEVDDVASMPASDKAGGAEMGSNPQAAGDEYSKTNVQVEGVDEGDIVKNDGEYIYMINSDSVRIVKATPPDKLVELDKVTFDKVNGFYPTEMYVDGNTLVAVGSSYSPPEYWVYKEGTETMAYYGSVTRMYIFDITDRENVKLRREVDFEGDYISSRKIDDVVYLVSSKYIYGYTPVPMYYDSNTKKLATVGDCSDVLYYPRVTQDYSYLTVAGVPVNNKDAKISQQVVLGNGSNVYASLSNLYVAENKYNFSWRYMIPTSEEKTTIHKFALSDPAVTYVGSGEVPGTILNQFSMDENDGYFRIATTLGDLWDTENPAKNNVYVMDENMNRVGSLEGLAPGEKIYSVRFMGDRAYIVTFKKIDPLFVIDTSNPTAPKVLGKLKIPGYSDYLHPYDENHLIGFGKDAIDGSEDEMAINGLNFAWYQGIQIAMFDVTDVNNPKQLHKMVIGDRGTDSELLYNHKALLFDKDLGIMAFPITLAQIPDNLKNDPNTSSSTYGDYIYQGAYIFDISITDGFGLRGRITQYDANEVKDKSGYYWYGDKDINRIIYIGDNFYTISNLVVTSNKMTDLSEIDRVELKDVDTYPIYQY